MSADDRCFKQVAKPVLVNDGGYCPDDLSTVIYLCQDHVKLDVWSLVLSINRGPFSYSSHLSSAAARDLAATLLEGADMLDEAGAKASQTAPAVMASAV